MSLGVPTRAEDEAIISIFEGLQEIEAVLKAESKRRTEAN